MSRLLTQRFKTLAGAQKRARFETAHSKTHVFNIVRCDLTTGEPDSSPSVYGQGYVWRLRKVSKADAAKAIRKLHEFLSKGPPT